MDRTENAIIIVDRLLALGESLQDACRIAGISVHRFEKFKELSADREFGAWLKTLRTKNGLSPEAFAKSLSLGTQAYTAIESGKRSAPAGMAAKIREVYSEEYPAQHVPAQHVPSVGTAKSPAGTVLIIQAPDGKEITAEEIALRVGEADRVYIRADQGKAFWVRGEENGSIDLWYGDRRERLT